MAVPDPLVTFVHDALARGLPRADIEAALRRAGWASEAVRDALDHYADVAFPVSVPRPKPYLSAREAFLYLLLFGTLFVSAINLGTLLFQLIDLAFPAPGPRILAPLYDTIRWAVSALVVAAPVYLYLSRYTTRELRRDPAKRASKTRRWLTYLTLFVGAAVLIGDLIALVYNLLGGELTDRFVLKVLTVGGIAGAVFGYYLRDLRKDEVEVPAGAPAAR